MPTMRSRTRRSFYLSKQGSTSMAKDDDAGKNGNNTAGLAFSYSFCISRRTAFNALL